MQSKTQQLTDGITM